MDKFARDLMKKLHEIYGYEYFELQETDGLIGSFCTVLREQSGITALIFTSAENASGINMSEITNELSMKLHTGFVNVVIIALTDGNMSLSSVYYPTIEVNYRDGGVTYHSQECMIYAQHVADCMNYIKFRRMSRSRNELPIVTIALIAINVLYFLLSAYLSGGMMNISNDVLVALGAKYNSGIASGQYYRLVTCMFLHGGIIHIATNMYTLYLIGPLVEKIYGRKKYLGIYFISGISSSLLSYLMSPGISIGASGAIFGLFGACLIFASRMKKRIGKGFLSNIIQVIVINLIIGFTLPNIDNFAHIGGLLGGVVTGTAFFNKSDQ